MTNQQVVLVILDGWGIGPKNDSNPAYIQGTPNIDYIKTNFLTGALQASGISVGLPWNEKGNSEVGHLTIGAGKILYQHFPRITLAIRDGSFSKNKVFLDAFNHAKKNKSAVNLIGLLTEGNIHASLEHLISLIKIAKEQQVPKINLHIFSDGKDSRPKSARELVRKLSEETGGGWKMGSISGRFYALDRDHQWQKTQLAYEALIGAAPQANIEEGIQSAYEKNLNDQYIEPRTIDPEAVIQNNDSLIFFDFREDGIRQISSAFILKDFAEFPVKKFSNLYIGTMTRYADNFMNPVAYPSEIIENPLAKVLAENNKTQLRLAETEKYAHVTYFFNAYREQPYPNEYRILIPSHKIANHAQKPEMQAAEITARTIQAIQEQAFNFILVNYANGDMVAHTGDYAAAKIAVRTIDEAVGKLMRAALARNSALIITSDHGNVEVMLDSRTGEITTTHDPSPVPIYIIGNEFVRLKSKTEAELAEKEAAGILSDIAPTILKIMGIPKPPEMTGENLLEALR